MVDIKTVKGLKKIRKGFLPDIPAYRFRKEVHGLQFPSDVATRVRSEVQGSFTIHFVGKQNKRTDSVLFSVDVPQQDIPWLRLSSDVKRKALRLQFRTESGRPNTVTFSNVLVNHKSWHQLALTINSSQVKMYADCREAETKDLTDNIDFSWPQNAVISILQDASGEHFFKVTF